MGCVWLIYRKMELCYWLVPGNVKINRLNQLNEKCSLMLGKKNFSPFLNDKLCNNVSLSLLRVHVVLKSNSPNLHIHILK